MNIGKVKKVNKIIKVVTNLDWNEFNDNTNIPASYYITRELLSNDKEKQLEALIDLYQEADIECRNFWTESRLEDWFFDYYSQIVTILDNVDELEDLAENDGFNAELFDK